MEADRKDYQDSRKQVPEDQRQRAKIVVQQAVNAELLTGNEHWDTFLSFLQSFIDRATISKNSFADMLLDPSTTNPDEMMKAKIGWTEADATIKTLEAVISLPRELIHTGKIAKEWLDEIGPG